jgi:hypothetical protein
MHFQFFHLGRSGRPRSLGETPARRVQVRRHPQPDERPRARDGPTVLQRAS